MKSSIIHHQTIALPPFPKLKSSRFWDVKIIFNFEYRQQTNTFIDFAVFVDAGNVWTIKEYEKQQGVVFYINEFYKQLGLSWVSVSAPTSSLSSYDWMQVYRFTILPTQ